ncbi:MAG: diacylglycerol kinase family lipid kinase [Anaerolineae bacterium]|nr:diacylglycerol kinase family lipid kinase [Anaerolineae bacterium]
MRAYLIWNPMAGQRDVRNALEEAVEVLEGAGWSIRLYDTVHPGDGTRLARAAAEEGAQVALAAGGDGTVNEVVNGLVGTDVALGVLPVGTGNTWAKELGYPAWVPPYRHPLREAAQALAESSVHRVDVGRANGRYFLLWAGVGFDAEVAHEVESLIEMKRRLGLILYAVSGVSLALSFVGTRSTVVIDGRPFRRRVLMVAISNARLYGGGLFQLAPAAYIDDGRLDVFVFRGHGPTATFQHFFRLLTQYHMRDPSMDYYRARTVEIYTDRPMAVQVDGEPHGQTPLTAEVVPGALKILVPRSAPATIFQAPVPARAPR